MIVERIPSSRVFLKCNDWSWQKFHHGVVFPNCKNWSWKKFHPGVHFLNRNEWSWKASKLRVIILKCKEWSWVDIFSGSEISLSQGVFVKIFLSWPVLSESLGMIQTRFQSLTLFFLSALIDRENISIPTLFFGIAMNDHDKMWDLAWYCLIAKNDCEKISIWPQFSKSQWTFSTRFAS